MTTHYFRGGAFCPEIIERVLMSEYGKRRRMRAGNKRCTNARKADGRTIGREGEQGEIGVQTMPAGADV
jgi:hypothetical protein